jgi:hypothetical protein
MMYRKFDAHRPYQFHTNHTQESNRRLHQRELRTPPFRNVAKGWATRHKRNLRFELFGTF